ncbi:MAG: anti-sigma factor [Tepidiformaceae bacterium]
MTEHNELPQAHPADLLPELALGVLPEAEAESVREHLAGCTECTAELREMDRVAGLLPFGVEDVAPSPAIKAGLMERIAHEPRRLQPPTRPHLRPRYWLGAAAAGIAVLVLAGAVGFLLGNSGGGSASGSGSLKAENLRQAALVQSVANDTVLKSTVTEGPASATLLRAPGSSDAYAWLEGLPALPAGKAYQAWLTSDGKQFDPSTVFSNGQGVWLVAGRDFGTYAVVALTIEDAGGARQPTQAPFLEVKLYPGAGEAPGSTS